MPTGPDDPLPASLRVLVVGQGHVGLPLALHVNIATNDARETSADAVVGGLVDLDADVVVHDEHVGPHELDLVAPRVPLSPDLVRSCHVVVLVADHDDVDYDLLAGHAEYIFDTRNLMRGACVGTL